MNAQSLWAGNDYAHVAYRPNKQEFVSGAERVKIIRVTKEQPRYGAERGATTAEVFVLNDDGSHRLNYNQENMVKKVRARDVLMFWHEYEDEREHRATEAAKIEAERNELARKEREETQLLSDALVAKGIPANSIVRISSGANTITLNKTAIAEWLGVS